MISRTEGPGSVAMHDQGIMDAIEELRRTKGPFLLFTDDRFLFLGLQRDVDDQELRDQNRDFLIRAVEALEFTIDELQEEEDA